MANREELNEELQTLRRRLETMPERLREAARRAVANPKAQAEFVQVLVEREVLPLQIADLERQFEKVTEEEFKRQYFAEVEKLRDLEKQYAPILKAMAHADDGLSQSLRRGSKSEADHFRKEAQVLTPKLHALAQQVASCRAVMARIVQEAQRLGIAASRFLKPPQAKEA